MKNWIYTIVGMKGKLEGLCKAIDDRVEKLALDMSTPANELFNKINLYNDVKRRVVNIKVMSKRILDVLDEQENLIICAYGYGYSMQKIADKLKISKSSVCRKLNMATYKGIRALIKFSIDKERMAKDYSEIELIYRTYRKFCRKSLDRQRVSNDIANVKEKKERKGIIRNRLIYKLHECNRLSI